VSFGLPLLLILVAYLFGSAPFGLLIARYGAGVDIRRVGSGNIGATNVARAIGFRWGLAVLLLDVLKGVLPTLLPRFVLAADSPLLVHTSVACGIAAVVGHMFPIWLWFRGGKGVATGLGVAAVLGPWATLAAFLTFALVVPFGRYVALASVVASLVFAATTFALLGGGAFSATNWSLAAFALVVPLLIVIRHRGNLARLWAGTEPPFSFGSKDREIEAAE
jgi:acyl phosphate:glycerol-3-phosphate acyltransferase